MGLSYAAQGAEEMFCLGLTATAAVSSSFPERQTLLAIPTLLVFLESAL